MRVHTRVQPRDLSRPVAVLLAFAVTLVVTVAAQLLLEDRADAAGRPGSEPVLVAVPSR